MLTHVAFCFVCMLLLQLQYLVMLPFVLFVHCPYGCSHDDYYCICSIHSKRKVSSNLADPHPPKKRSHCKAGLHADTSSLKHLCVEQHLFYLLHSLFFRASICVSLIFGPCCPLFCLYVAPAVAVSNHVAFSFVLYVAPTVAVMSS